MRAIQVQEFGGPEVLRLVDVPVPEPSAGEVLIRVTRAGINFADTHQRRNEYLAAAELPLIPGAEVVGVREDTGERVVAMCGTGGYAEYATAPEALTVPLPDGVDDGTALALVLQGLTAWHLYRTCARVQEGESVVVHAAAGGVGSLAVQLGRPMGAGRVIATASSEEKRALALELGADAAVDAAPDGLADRLVAYGNASGEANSVPTGRLMRRSAAVVGFWLVHCLRRPEMISGPLGDLFARAARGELRAIVGATYPLADARQAHADMQARRTTGKLLLDPTAD